MKKFTLEATKENVLNTIQNNTYNRNMDIKDFIEALDLIEGNMFISLDAKWVAGKTFYVRQIEQTLKYLTSKKKKMNIAELEPYFSRNGLDEIKLNHTYFPVYYNAWLYDNHSDPLMSLILNITKVCECYCDEKLRSNTLSDKIISLMDSFSFSIGYVQIGSNFENLKQKFSGKDILSVVKTEEEIRDKVKEIFDSIITENVQKLVIFIDELDRCRPNFAIEMLERIKHYFDDDRIIFIASINRSQLIHSISKYYGANFDSTGYLDKFFDKNIYLPEISIRDEIEYMLELEFTDKQYHLRYISEDLNAYYKLSLRENLRFYESISFAASSKYIYDQDGQGLILSAFVPIIAILNIKDENKKIKFMNGDSSILKQLFEAVPALHQMACLFGKENGTQEEKYKIGYEKIKEVYDYTFGNNKRKLYKGSIRIDNNLKSLCIKLCSGLKV